MQDRISMYPGRIRLIPVDTNNGIYDVVRADEPTQEGTPLNTANLFSSATSKEILTYTLDSNRNSVTKPDTVNQGIRSICSLYGATEWAPRCNFSFEGDAAGKGEFVDTSIKYLASLGAVFVNISFIITDQTYSTSYILIKVESTDPTVGDLFASIYGTVPMISNVPETNFRPSMNNQGGIDLYIEIPSSGGLNAARNVMTVVGMYQCRTVFTVSGGLFEGSSPSPYTFVISPGTTWSEWIGTSRQFIFKGNRFVFRIYAGAVVSSDLAYALSLDGNTAVRSNDIIQNGAEYSIINWSAESQL